MTEDINAALADLDLADIDDLSEQSLGNTKETKTDDLHFFQEVPLKVTLEVASAEITLGELSRVQDGDVLPLDKMAGEALDVMVNGMLFAKGQVVMVDGRYGIKFIKENPQSQPEDVDEND